MQCLYSESYFSLCFSINGCKGKVFLAISKQNLDFFCSIPEKMKAEAGFSTTFCYSRSIRSSLLFAYINPLRPNKKNKYLFNTYNIPSNPLLSQNLCLYLPHGSLCILCRFTERDISSTVRCLQTGHSDRKFS